MYISMIEHVGSGGFLRFKGSVWFGGQKGNIWDNEGKRSERRAKKQGRGSVWRNEEQGEGRREDRGELLDGKVGEAGMSIESVPFQPGDSECAREAEERGMGGIRLEEGVLSSVCGWYGAFDRRWGGEIGKS